MKALNVFFTSMILINLVTLYFVIDLFSYDEISGHLLNGGIKTIASRGFAYLLFITTLFNLYFISYILIRRKFKD